MTSLRQDIRYGLRMLVKAPGFAVIVILILSLGIGTCTAIFSVVDAVLLNPIPSQNADRMVEVGEINPARHWDWPVARVSPALFFDLADLQGIIEHMVAYTLYSVIVFSGEAQERLDGCEVTPNFFEHFGIRPELGRTFRPEEGEPGKNHVVVISHALWKQSFGGDPNLIGRTLLFGSENLEEPEVRKAYTVIGIMPACFLFPKARCPFWVPRAMTRQDISAYRRFGRNWDAMARLKPGVSLRRAQAVLDVMTQRLAQDDPENCKGWQIRVRAMRDRFVGERLQQALLGLAGAALFLLLISCSNVASLLLARFEARHREITIRIALGASRYRVIKQLLTEAILLALLAGTIALLFAAWGIDLLTVFVEGNMPRLQPVGMNLRVLDLAVCLSILTGIGFGIAPAWHSFRTRPAEAMKENQRTVGCSPGRQRIRSLLVVSEVALAFMLLIGAGLMIQTVTRLLHTDPGFDPHNLMGLQIEMPMVGYESYGQRQAIFKEFADRFRALPGVSSLGVCRSQGAHDYEIEATTTQAHVWLHYCGTGDLDYFRAMKIPLRRGRLLTPADADSSPKSMVINESMARLCWPGQDPLGKRCKEREAEYVVVGVIADAKDYGLGLKPEPMCYLPLEDLLRRGMTWPHFIIRAHDDPLALNQAIRRITRELIPNSPAPLMWSMEKELSDSTKMHRGCMLLMNFFGVVGIALALLGTYGIAAYAAARRTHEIGIRIALGAGDFDVLRLIVGQGIRLTVVGVAVGLGGALFLTQTLSTLLYNVSPTDPFTFVCVSLLLTASALLASYIPARRAAKTDPMAALRYE